MIISNQLKQGDVYTYQVPQNSANYIVRLAITSKGLWMNIQQSYMQWKLTISEELAMQTIAKATANKYSCCGGAEKIELKMVYWDNDSNLARNVERKYREQAIKQSKNLLDFIRQKQKVIQNQLRLHLPFTFLLNDICEKQKIIQAIKTMKDQLDELKIANDKSQTSFSIMTESVMAEEQLKMQNQELKKKIKIYEESLIQKRGAVEIDNILREKNNLQIIAETKKRQQVKQITRLKNMHALMEREITQLRNQVNLLNRQLLLLQDSMGNPAKLKSHAMRVLKSYENDLRVSKKTLQKQLKDIETLKRNIATSKNNQRKQITKIKSIETEIQQAKKKANVREISNRLHSPGSSRNSGSLKAPSVASDDSDAKKSNKSNNKITSNNLVRQNLLKRTTDLSNRNQRSLSNTGSKNKDDLMKTTPNIKGSPAILRKTEYKPPIRPVASSHIVSNQGSRQLPARQKSQQNDVNSVKSSSADGKKREFSPADRQRQKQAMQRLAGGVNKNKAPITKSSSGKNITKPSSTTKIVTSSVAKKDNAKDILNRMKEVKAQYNNRSKNSAVKEQGIAAKVAQLTSQKTLG